VSAGDLELGVVTLPVPTRDLDITELAVDEIVLVARADHPFATRRVPVTDLDGQPFVAFESGSAIRQIIDAALRAAGVEIDVVMELRSIPSILRRWSPPPVSLAFVSRLSLPAEPSPAGDLGPGFDHLEDARAGHTLRNPPIGAGRGVRRVAEGLRLNRGTMGLVGFKGVVCAHEVCCPGPVGSWVGRRMGVSSVGSR
jgi:hypothetical protein